MSTTPPHPTADLETNHALPGIAARLAAMWRRGWQPLDLARVIGTAYPPATALFADALTVNRSTWHPHAAAIWVDQAETVGAPVLPWWDPQRPYWQQFLQRHRCDAEDAASAVAFLHFIDIDGPELPGFEPPPHEPAREAVAGATDSSVLAKVRALLAKAESTTFDEEAEALSAKAQQLIARHSIDLALLADEIDIPGGRRLFLDPPYTKAKFVLLSCIADANNCRSAWNTQRDTATLIGHQSDMTLTEMLFTSLLLQGTSAVIQAGAQYDIVGRPSTRSWRNAFWYGFAYRIGERLRAAAASARTEAVATEGQGLLPVLAARSDAVDRTFEETFPRLGTIDMSLSNVAGLHAGRSFADSAELTSENSVRGRRQRSLPA